MQLFGFTVPAFVTRRAETFVRLHNQQTLIIAGLILENQGRAVDKVPYLGDMPYAGGLFRTTSYSDQKTDLVMSVTPQIVAPLPEERRSVAAGRSRAAHRDEIRPSASSRPMRAGRGSNGERTESQRERSSGSTETNPTGAGRRRSRCGW